MAGETAPSPLIVFTISFVASSAAGIAAYLRSGKKITTSALLTAGLNSGLLGLAISLLWFDKFKDNIYFLLGICVITGLTGAAGLDFILTAFQEGGFSIKLGERKNKDGTIDLGVGLKKHSGDVDQNE